MKQNRKQLIIMVCTLALLLTGAVLLPVLASATTTNYINLTFQTIALGTKGTDLKDAISSTQSTPSTATVVTDPVDPANGNLVVRIDSRTDAANDADAVTEAKSGGNNVDRNFTPNNPEISYTTHKKVVLQVSYYVPTGASGTFQSQAMRYRHSGAPENYATWLDLYRIDLGNGSINTEAFGNSSQTHPFPKDQWNTVSLVLDLVTGDLNFYINNVLVQSGKLNNRSTNLTNITINAGYWNIAKLNKSGGNVNAYSGCYYVDNAVIHSYDEGMEKTFSTDNSLGSMYVTVTNLHGVSARQAGDCTVLLNHGVTAEQFGLSDDILDGIIAPVPGASIRISGMSGIRFATQISTEKLNAILQLKEEGMITDVEIGTIITPRSYVEEAGAFTVEALQKLNHSVNLLEIPATVGKYYNLQGVTLDEGYDRTFVGSIVDVRPGNLAREFAGIGYIKLLLSNGNAIYRYSYDYDPSTVGSYSRSIANVAAAFVNDPAFADHKELLQSLSKGANTKWELESNLLYHVEYSYDALYFQNAAGVSNRLTYDGNNGWRLQSIKPTGTALYDSFQNIGAAQSLSVYMGEGYHNPTTHLTVTEEGNSIRVNAEGTDTYVRIAISGAFNIWFLSGDDRAMGNVNTIYSGNGEIYLKGDLQDGEAIYGGGERFDAANKRGKELTLYTYDAYNGGSNKSGTYTVIPLFTSSRGSGFYVNRYEPMVADFGKAESDQWKVTIDNDLSDVYFYATGNITDPLRGYTDLSGHADLPEEWAQGILICRYSPDFSVLEGQVVYETIEELPNYTVYTISGSGQNAYANKDSIPDGSYLMQGGSRKYIYKNGVFYRVSPKGNPSGAGVKTIVENLIAAGMRPDAMVLEGLSYDNLSNGSASANAELANFKEVMAYLDEMGIKATVYMGIAGLNSSMAGYKPEYHLRANVIKTDTAGNLISQDLATHRIPKADTVNPDAIGSSSQSYLDITNPEAVEWHINSVWGFLAELGVDGVKIDFCETMPNEGSFATSSGITTVEYLWHDPSLFEGDDIHHAYPTYYISMFYKRMLELKEERAIPDGFVLLSRGGGIGSQRNPYMWAGDQTRCESNLHVQLLSVINSGISGIPFMTYDMAGYAYSSTGGYFKDGQLGSTEAEVRENEGKVFARAMQFTVFGNTVQTHGDVRHVYELSEETQQISATYTKLHKDLMPYIRKMSQYACDTGIPMIRHLILQYQNDANVRNIDNQFMLGDAVLLAPILSITNNTREVYLPKGEWIDLLTGERISVGAEGKKLTVTAAMDQIPAYLNTASADAALLVDVFNGEAWQSINRGNRISLTDITTNDPYEEDLYEPVQ